MDLSLPLENAQTFIFVTPVIGQYVRIYPLLGVDSADFRCLKFEIIGCLYTGKYNIF